MSVTNNNSHTQQYPTVLSSGPFFSFLSFPPDRWTDHSSQEWMAGRLGFFWHFCAPGDGHQRRDEQPWLTTKTWQLGSSLWRSSTHVSAWGPSTYDLWGFGDYLVGSMVDSIHRDIPQQRFIFVDEFIILSFFFFHFLPSFFYFLLLLLGYSQLILYIDFSISPILCLYHYPLSPNCYHLPLTLRPHRQEPKNSSPSFHILQP